VMDLRGDARLVEEHHHELAVLRELGVQALRRHDPREPDIADQVRDVDRRHAALRDLAMEHVAPDGDRSLLLAHVGTMSCPRVSVARASDGYTGPAWNARYVRA